MIQQIEVQCMRDLPVPESVKDDPNARELLRVWAAHGSQHVVLNPGAWEDPAAWGIALVDLARHIARAYELEARFSVDEALKRIIAGFEAEMQHPTDQPTGGFEC